MPTAVQVGRAMRLTYAQAMLSAVFNASTGGMFLIGFALQLGADNVRLGLLSTVPQLLVVFQLLAAWLVERGVSRKRLTVAFAFLTPLCWFLIGGLPLLAPRLSVPARFGLLLGVMALVTLAAQFAGNARASWVGELVPAERRGRFFGYCSLFAGIIGAVFAVGEGRFLDFVRSRGLFAFTGLFFFGALFGLLAAALNLPQPDCPLPGGPDKPPFARLVSATFRNRRLALLALVHATIALAGIAGPFTPAYCLRDVGLTFFGLGLLNAVTVATMLLSSPLWGRLVDRFGARPVLILGLLLLAPCGLVWLFIPPGAARMAYLLLPWSNALAGVGIAALNVAIAALMYKLSAPQGRSAQFAVYSSFVTLVGAPMPVLGGWLVSRLEGSGWHIDLRLTFYLWMAFLFLAAFLAKFLQEPQSASTRVLVFRYLPSRMTEFWDSLTSTWVYPVLGAPPRRRPAPIEPARKE